MTRRDIFHDDGHSDPVTSDKCLYACSVNIADEIIARMAVKKFSSAISRENAFPISEIGISAGRSCSFPEGKSNIAIRGAVAD